VSCTAPAPEVTNRLPLPPTAPPARRTQPPTGRTGPAPPGMGPGPRPRSRCTATGPGRPPRGRPRRTRSSGGGRPPPAPRPPRQRAGGGHQPLAGVPRRESVGAPSVDRVVVADLGRAGAAVAVQAVVIAERRVDDAEQAGPAPGAGEDGRIQPVVVRHRPPPG